MMRLAIVLWLACTPVFGEGFGNVAGRIVFDGPRPKPRPLVLDAPTLCVPGGVVADESLVVGREGGIANVFVYLRKPPSEIHPDLVAVPDEPVRFLQQGCVFRPHALFARAGQGVRVESLDPVAHTTHTYPIANPAVNFVVPAAPAEPRLVEMPKREFVPIAVKCDVYPWMSAYWLVLDHPYAAVSGGDGTFRIDKLPAGEHVLRLWHEKAGYLSRDTRVVVKAGETTTLDDLVYRPKAFE